MTITAHFERFHNFDFERSFLKGENLFYKTGVLFFLLKVLQLKSQHFHIRLPLQMPMLRQIEWGLQNGPTVESGISPLTTLFFLKYEYKKLLI